MVIATSSGQASASSKMASRSDKSGALQRQKRPATINMPRATAVSLNLWLAEDIRGDSKDSCVDVFWTSLSSRPPSAQLGYVRTLKAGASQAPSKNPPFKLQR